MLGDLSSQTIRLPVPPVTMNHSSTSWVLKVVEQAPKTPMVSALFLMGSLSRIYLIRL